MTNNKLARKIIREQLENILIEADKFQARIKGSGNISDFGSKEARDAAVKKGTHDSIKPGETGQPQKAQEQPPEDKSDEFEVEVDESTPEWLDDEKYARANDIALNIGLVPSGEEGIWADVSGDKPIAVVQATGNDESPLIPLTGLPDEISDEVAERINGEMESQNDKNEEEPEPESNLKEPDEKRETEPSSLRDAKITPESIGAIDDLAKKGGMEGTVAAPGNIGSKINEIAVGNAMAMFNENPDMSVEAVVEQLLAVFGDTPEGLKNGEEKNRNTLRAAAISAKRENVRVQEFMASEDLDTAQTTISHVWGSQESLENTVKFLEDAGVEEVNGISLKDADPPPSYEEIILAGGAGENPTDTMITMLDSSKSPPKAIILHTSNKMATSDIQSNSSPENNIRGMITQADKLLSSGDLTDAEHKQITQEANETIEKISKLQGEVESKINASFSNLQKEAKNGTLAEKMNGESEGKWGQIMNRYTKTGGAGAPPKEFRVQVSTPMTKSDKNKIADAYVREMEYLATTEEEVEPPSKWMTAMMARVGMSTEEKEGLNGLYRQQHDVTNEMRVNMNETKEGFGDKVMAQTFMSRLHLNLAEGHAPGGIPPQYFELNMGINNSNIRYDENDQPHMKEGNKFYPVDIETGYIDTSAEPVKISKLNSGTTATIGNMDTIAIALGYKIPPTPENIAEKITVGSVESAKVGPSGKAFIYGINVAGEEVIIGMQKTRPKDGPGTKPQDTIEWAKDFQTRLQLVTARQAMQESGAESIKEESVKYDLQDIIALDTIVSDFKVTPLLPLSHIVEDIRENTPIELFLQEIENGIYID